MNEVERTTIGLLHTKPLQDHLASGMSIGQFELEITVDLRLLKNSGDALAFTKHTIAAHLASATQDTEVPAEYWQATLEPWFAHKFYLPAFFDFGALS